MPDTPSIDIRPDHWLIVQSVLHRHVPQHEVWAFGSRAKWTAKEYSELDLAVITDKPLSLDVIAGLSDDFSESDLPYNVDVVDWATTSESFRKIIERDKVVVQVLCLTAPIQLKTEALLSMCEAVVDCPHSTPVWTDSGFVVLRNQNIKDGRLDLSAPSYTDEEHFQHRTRRIAPRAQDIVITREAPMGEVCKIPEGLQCCLGQRQVLLRPRAGIDPDYLLYALQSPFVQNQIRWNEGTGSTVSNIRIPVLEKIEIPRHGVAESNIARILSSIDAKIDLNRRINQTLEAMAQAIFKSWFVDFDPVKAKIAAWQEGRDPLRAAMSAISGKAEAKLDALPREQYQQLSATAALFPDEMEESELGDIPKGWDICALPDCIDLNPPRSLKKGVSAPYLDMANVPTYAARVDGVVQRAFGSGSKFINGDTLLARITPCLENGKTAYVDFLRANEVGWGSTEFIVMRPKDDLPLPFAYFLCRHPEFRSFVISQMAGTSGRQRVPNDCFGAFKLVKPSFAVAEAFGVLATLYMRQIKAQDEASKTLAALRDTLLPKLMSGELSVIAPVESIGVA